MLETPRGAREMILAAIIVILIGLGAIAQANAPANEQKPTTPAAPIAILSDTMGVDFGPYIKQVVVPRVRQHWCSLIPENAKWKKSIVALEFSITKDGSVPGMRLAGTSNDVDLDRAAWGGITESNPFSPLPEEFKGRYLALRLSFYYNPNGDIKGDHLASPLSYNYNPNHATPISCGSDHNPGTEAALSINPSGPVKVEVGSSQKFSASLSGVKWAIAGGQCARLDCGTISDSGLYIPPTKASEPVSLTVTATQAAASFKSASTQVTILPPNSSK